MKAISKLKKILQVDLLFRNFLVPTALLLFYCGSFAFITPRLLSRGVNFYFTRKLWNYLLILLAVECLIALIMFFIKKDRPALKKTSQSVRFSDFIYILLPITAVGQYLISNQSIITAKDFLFTTVFFVVFSSVLIVAIPALLSRVGSTRITMAVGLAFAFSIINMAMLSRDFNWLKEGTLGTQLVYLGAVFLVSWLLLGVKNRGFASLLILVYFLANTGMQLISPQTDVKSRPNSAVVHPLMSLVKEGEPAVKRNIYLLVYDSYVANETTKSYGIDNSSQEEFLKDAGFVLYPHTYSVGAKTVVTMSRMLNASTDYYGVNRRGVSGDGVVHNALKSLGYQTYGVFTSDYMFRGVGSTYDYSFPKGIVKDASKLLTSAILIGEFKFDLGMEFDAQSHDEYAEQKQRILAGGAKEPAFVYSHSNLPSHSQNSGKCLADETELFKDRLELANAEMRRDVETLAANDPQAIVIIAGDHGPYLTKTCTSTARKYPKSEISRKDIQDRFGSFLAIRWPTDEYTAFDEITVIQDVFPAVFAYLYNDTRILEMKIKPDIVDAEVTSGASVSNGIIIGGMDDGEPLYLEPK